MGLARYFVFPGTGDWLIALEGAALAHHPSREEALSSAIVMADLMGSMHYDADVMIEEGGALRLAWSHGIDAVPARLNAQ